MWSLNCSIIYASSVLDALLFHGTSFLTKLARLNKAGGLSTEISASRYVHLDDSDVAGKVISSVAGRSGFR